MKHHSVVANFLFKSQANGEPLVALFRRSYHPNVHTYQGKLAPISGSIDIGDLDAASAAARELREETGLISGRDALSKFCGASFSFTDDQAARSWTVYPFGWTLTADESRIKLDWEHSSWEWISPHDIISNSIADDCVPRIYESFRRVYFGSGGIFGDRPSIKRDNEAGRAFTSGLDRIRTDNENGARVLATEAVMCLAMIARKMDYFDWRALKIAAYHLIYSARPSMNAAISSAVLAALKQESLSIISESTSVRIADKSEFYLEERDAASNEISKSFTSFVRQHCQGSNQVNIITLSSSSSIRSSILHLLSSNPELHLTLKILESRPLCEGVALASSILSSTNNSHLQIQIAPDSHVATLALTSPAPSILLLGADRISPSGHVSNKTGSSSAAIVTKRLSPDTKIVVLSETDKIAAPSKLMAYEKSKEDANREMEEHSPELHDPNEITRAWAAAGVGEEVVERLTQPDVSVEVLNVYFEWIPRQYIDVYICEDGILLLDRIREISLEKARLENEMFAGLYDG